MTQEIGMRPAEPAEAQSSAVPTAEDHLLRLFAPAASRQAGEEEQAPNAVASEANIKTRQTTPQFQRLMRLLRLMRLNNSKAENAEEDVDPSTMYAAEDTPVAKPKGLASNRPQRISFHKGEPANPS